jgi:hypothetical protein
VRFQIGKTYILSAGQTYAPEFEGIDGLWDPSHKLCIEVRG